MPLIRLKDARESDVLAANVLDPGGRLLVAKSVELTPHLLLLLHERGVERLYIKARTAGAETQTDAQREAIRASVERRFQWVSGDAFMRSLKEIVLRTAIVEPDAEAGVPPAAGGGEEPVA